MTSISDLRDPRTGFNDVADVLETGTYTPTLTNSSNVASSTVYTTGFFRIDNMVTVAGRLEIDATALGLTEFFLTLPIASSLVNSEDLGGVGHSRDGVGLRILAEVAGSRAKINFTGLSTSNTIFSFTFTYQVI